MSAGELPGLILTPAKPGTPISSGKSRSNFGLWVIYAYHENLAFLLHPQIWLAPVGVILLAAEHLHRERLVWYYRQRSVCGHRLNDWWYSCRRQRHRSR